MAVNHNAIYKVTVWIAWVVLFVLGAYNVYVQFKGDEGSKSTQYVTRSPVNKLLAIYISVFGLIGCIFEAGVESFQRALKFLKSKSGHGVFFIFVATLCLAFVSDDDYTRFIDIWDFVLVPVIMGCTAAGVGIYCFVAICCGHKDKDDEIAADGDYVQAGDGSKRI